MSNAVVRPSALILPFIRPQQKKLAERVPHSTPDRFSWQRLTNDVMEAGMVLATATIPISVAATGFLISR